MIKLEPYQIAYHEMIVEQDSMNYLKPFFKREHMQALQDAKYSYTGFFEGRPVFCAGVVEYWKDRGEAWAIIDRNVKHCFLSIHNTVKKFLEECPIRRIEAVVDLDFIAGHRWVQNLGFKLEAKFLEAYGPPNGRNCSLYARVKECPQA